MYIFQKDRFQAVRGGSSRVLDITCDHCGAHVTYYQKDGPGPLKRMYIDRIINNIPTKARLLCNACKTELGVLFTYEKEKRAAYRLFVGAVNKKIVSKSLI